MYVQTEPILLFRRTDRNCYINIIEHAPANTIMSTCTFLYYHQLTVHATVVTNSHFYYLINIHDELKITCGKYSRETVCHSHSVSIIKWTDTRDYVIQSVVIQFIGSHYNCSFNGNFIIYHTFNFVTKWLHNKKVMPYYRENEHILRLPSSASIPSLNDHIQLNKCVYLKQNPCHILTTIGQSHWQYKKGQNIFVKTLITYARTINFSINQLCKTRMMLSSSWI